ncbi:DUF1330 domain-containing protein [Paracoccaceae bacterium]|nr:DUF1330 domain-containing protein [Paracoccaceae bacterium]|tara:strand:- start:23 stop:313 length:291 start_codon:yes stop_codon:yes gene_type:complete
MPKGYFVSAHRSEADPEKRAAYLKLAGPAIAKYNGKILASTNKIKVFEDGKVEQTVLIEFESFEKASECIDSKEYQDALIALDGGANRDCRVFEGL